MIGRQFPVGEDVEALRQELKTCKEQLAAKEADQLTRRAM